LILAWGAFCLQQELFILTNIKQTMGNEAKVDATFGANEENI
jgi:hypothetical protein